MDKGASMSLTPQEIGAARASVLDFIDSQTLPKLRAIRLLNQLYAARKLPAYLMQSVKLAWQKPRNFKLIPRTYYEWVKERKERGHSEPLVRQKDMSVKPWHGLAFLLRDREPQRKTTDILKQLNQSYPNVSYGKLTRFYEFIDGEQGNT
jgi:hypothetical protein